MTLAWLVAVFLISAAGDSNWPQWRGPNGLAVSQESGLPTVWSATENIRWKTFIPGRGHSSPIVWGRKVFLTTSLEGDVVPGAKAVIHIRRGEPHVHPDSVGADRMYRLDLVCLDRDTGEILWQKTAYEGTVHDQRHRKNTYASSTPVTDGTRVVAFFEAEGLYCYDLDGNLLWKSFPGKIAKMGMGPGTSPVLYENLVIIQCDQEDGGAEAGSFIAAIDKETGKEVWRTARTHRKSHAAPFVTPAARGHELIASGYESIVAYDPATGRELWHTEGLAGYAIPSMVSGHGLVFVSGGYPNRRTMAIRPGGAGDVSASHVAWSYAKGSAYVPSPILYGDYLYIMTDKGLVTCLDAQTGAVQYEGERPPVPATFSASPVAFEGKILFTSEDGDTFVVRAGPQHAILRTNSLGEPIYASPAIAGGMIFMRGERNLYCISDTAAAP